MWEALRQKMEDLKKSLLDLGYSEAESNSILSKKKIYFQEDLDNITSKVKEKQQSHIEKDYVTKSEYNQLLEELNTTRKTIKINSIKEVFLKNEGNGDYFQDFIKVNEHLIDSDNKTLGKEFENAKKKSPWAFNESSLSDYGINDMYSSEERKISSSDLYSIDWEARIKERNK